MTITNDFLKASGYVSDAEISAITDEQATGEAGITPTVTATAAIVSTAATGAVATSQTLPDFCPSSACTTAC